MTFIESHLAPAGRKNGHIKLHGPEDFEAMRRAGRLTAEALDMLIEHVRPGVTTKALDDLVFDFAMTHGAYPAPLDYRGYRKSICTSINHVVCHGIPDDKALREGDIVNIDVTFILDGWHGDASRMFGVGEIPRRAQRLIDVTYESLLRGIAAAKPGATTGDIGAAIQTYAEAERCSIVRDFCGHGSAGCSTTSRTFCITARKAKAFRCVPACSSRRADGQPRASAGQDIVGRLDRGDARPFALGAIRAFGRGDRNRRRDIHPIAARTRQSHSGDAARRCMSGARDRQGDRQRDKPAAVRD